MPFDFPASPSEGQIFNAPSGPSYVFNTPVWKAIGQGQIAIISDTAPANPANGTLWYESDTGILFIWMNDGNSSQWVQAGGIAAGGAMREYFYTSSGTWTKPAGLQYLEVEALGGGGTGGNASATGASQWSTGGGGGSGGWGRHLYAASELPASVAYTVAAAGGSGDFNGLGVSAGAAGSTGSIGTVTSAQGGGGGGCTGSWNVPALGGRGHPGFGPISTMVLAGQGASSPFGSGGIGVAANAGQVANTAAGFGSGGSGASNSASGSLRNGGAGSPGFIRLREYY